MERIAIIPGRPQQGSRGEVQIFQGRSSLILKLTCETHSKYDIVELPLTKEGAILLKEAIELVIKELLPEHQTITPVITGYDFTQEMWHSPEDERVY